MRRPAHRPAVHPIAFTLYLSREMRDAIHAAASRAGVPMAIWMRSVIEDALTEQRLTTTSREN